MFVKCHFAENRLLKHKEVKKYYEKILSVIVGELTRWIGDDYCDGLTMSKAESSVG